MKKALVLSLVVSLASCGWFNNDVKPVANDVIECVKAEAAVASNGYSILQIAAEVYAALSGKDCLPGEDAVTCVERLATALVAKYGADIVACAIDNYPAPAPAPAPAAGSGSGTKVELPTATLVKRAALAKVAPGKKIVHTAAH